MSAAPQMNPNLRPPNHIAQVPHGSQTPAHRSEKNFAVALVLCFFLGAFGVHRFYSGKPVSGVFQLLTLGGLGIWCFIDFIMLACGVFKDGKGQLIKNG